MSAKPFWLRSLIVFAALSVLSSRSVQAQCTPGQIMKSFDGQCTPTDSVISESNGNVGIGTGTPAAKLEVVGNWGLGIPALRLSGEKPTIWFMGDAVSGNRSWFLHLGSNGPGDLEFYSDASPPSVPPFALRPESSATASQ